MENKIAIDFSGWVYVNARELDYWDIHGYHVNVRDYSVEEIVKLLNNHEIFVEVSQAIDIGEPEYETLGYEIPI